MRIKVENFKGKVPGVQPRLLPPGFAQIATDAVLETGVLSALRAMEAVYTFDEEKAVVIRHNGAWYGWSNPNVSVAPGPVAEDRLYVTGDGIPKLRYLAAEYELALRPPEVKATVAFTNKPADPVLDDPSDAVTLPTAGGTVPATLSIVREPVGGISSSLMLKHNIMYLPMLIERILPVTRI